MQGILAILLLTVLCFTGVRCQYVYGYNIHVSTFDCTGQPDGVAEIGCDGYVECQNGQRIKHLCEAHQVFSRDAMSCEPAHGSPCTDQDICLHKDDFKYADVQNHCETYYTCFRHVFYGHGYCPTGTVFHEALQICDWPNNTPAPCGTAK